MSIPRLTTVVEIRRLLAEQNAGELADRFVEHLQVAGHTLPGVLDRLTIAERERLVMMLFTVVGTGRGVH